MIIFLSSEVLTSQVTININAGTPAPRYYYLDDIECYYDIQKTQYIYFSSGRWIRARTLPKSYRHYNFNTGRKVIIKDYRGNSPNIYFREHRVKFPKGAKRSSGKSYWSTNDNKSHVKQSINTNQNFKGGNNSNFKSNKSNGSGRGHGRGNKK